MLKEAIVLAGGFGTRLGELTKHTPKPLLSVNGKPFLDILLNYLCKNKFTHVILSVGHLSDQIQNRYHSQFKSIQISYAVESSPLGTGGAIKHALSLAQEENVFVMNGDSFLETNFDDLHKVHLQNHADISMVLREIEDTARYGVIRCDSHGRVNAFEEKKPVHERGLINGGVYLINKSKYLQCTPDGAFSIEKEVFQEQCHFLNIYAITTTGFFIDIGIPDDYKLAQDAFKEFEY